MDTSSFLTVSQLSNELDSSEVIIKFLVKKFKQWIPATSHLGQNLYSHDCIITLIFLLEKLNRGVLPSTIEKEFINKPIKDTTYSKNSNNQKDVSFQERTVRALEKRAEAEEEKVLAMNNIANAITQFKTSFLNNFQNEQKNWASKPENSSQSPDTNELKSMATAIDDLSILIDVKPAEENPADKDHQVKIDDLSALLDNDQPNNIEMDDLSILIQDDKTIEIDTVEIDDLSLLIQNEESKNSKTDDLSILIQDQESNIVAIDDLSALIRKEKGSGEKPIIQKPKSSPKDDFEKYKSEIINIIIDLKEQGLTEKETCEQFNLEGILTFSGKTKWSVKTISQIYQLIENAA